MEKESSITVASQSMSANLISEASQQITELKNELEMHKATLEMYQFNFERETEIRLLGLTPRELSELGAPWEMFSYALTKKIDPTDQLKGLQLVTIPISADWNDQEFGKYRMFRVLGDSISTWGPSYFSTPKTISDAYRVFLDNIDIPAPKPGDQEKVEKARKKYNEAITNLETQLNKVGPHWLNFELRQSSLPLPRRLTFDQWYGSFDGRRIAPLQEEVGLAAQNLTHWIVQAYQGYGFAAEMLPNYNNPAFQLSAKSPSGEESFYRTYNITPDLNQWLNTSKQLAAAGAPPSLSFSFTKNSERRSSSETSWGGSASWWGGWWGFNAGAGGSRSTLDTSHEHFQMSFQAVNHATFTITPGKWFNATGIQTLAQINRWLPNGPIAQGLIKLWGPDGIFNIMSTELIVAFRPKITVTVKNDEFNQIKANFYAGGGFSIGPFGFGGSYNRRTEDVRFDESSNTITAEDSSDIPQIIAVVGAVLPNFK